MLPTLYALITHHSFDWSGRRAREDLVKNFEVIVRDMGNLTQVDTIQSSPLVKAARKLNNLVKMKKNVGLGKEVFVKQNLKTLKSYELQLGVTEGEKEGPYSSPWFWGFQHFKIECWEP